MTAPGLDSYRKNYFSQTGEDGIIAELGRRLGWTTGWFVEFGAWDGKHLSNTYYLLSQGGWQGVYIEGDPLRYRQLVQTCAEFAGRAHPLCAMVGFSAGDNLDHLLAATPIPRDFELLSIDIDSFDFQVWEAMEHYQPQIVIIESNCSIPPGLHLTHHPPAIVGASFSALVELGRRKGYSLVFHNGNCFFVRDELVPKLQLDPDVLASPEKLFDYAKYRKERLINLARKCLPKSWMQAAFAFADRRRKAAQKSA